MTILSKADLEKLAKWSGKPIGKLRLVKRVKIQPFNAEVKIVKSLKEQYLYPRR